MTGEELRIAVAALAAGPLKNHDEIIIAVAVEVRVESHLVESVLLRLRIRQVLSCVSTASDASEGAASVRYEKGLDWTKED